MKRYRLISDQLYTWSDDFTRKISCRLAKTPPVTAAAIAPTHRDPPWFAHRALQTLWQAWLQVCQRPGARSQVLSIGKLSGLSTSYGLCAAGVLRSDHRIPRQLPTNPRDLRGDLRDQPRATTASRGALRDRDGRCTLRAHRTVGNGIRRRSPGQYARSLARRRSERFDIWRGNG
jgi:hypothetical protein